MFTQKKKFNAQLWKENLICYSIPGNLHLLETQQELVFNWKFECYFFLFKYSIKYATVRFEILYRRIEQLVQDHHGEMFDR